MRIQHNIMAMNAYRNYNTNTSALSKNLEKLSSGYKINRAGDDAAGLAISEKMRAQITGLNAAQKNVKDGISLVKTAEGAMQEIQDMLNRMDYLATQSANGTYDDPVDRKNLQKEVEALKTEIDRIADSANFNGIKLLDGSLDPSTTALDKANAAADAAQKAADEALAAVDNVTVEPVFGEETAFTLPAQATNNTPTGAVESIYETEFKDAGKPGFSLTLDGVSHTFKDPTSTSTTAGEFVKVTIEGGSAAVDINLTEKDIADAYKEITGENAAKGSKANAEVIAKAIENKITKTGVSAGTAVAGEFSGADGNTYTAEAKGDKVVFSIKGTATEKVPHLDVKLTGMTVASNAAVKHSFTSDTYIPGTADTNPTMTLSTKVKLADGTEQTFTTAALDSDAAAADVVTALKAATATIDGKTVKLEDLFDVSTAGNKFTFAAKEAGAEQAAVTDLTITDTNGTAANAGALGTTDPTVVEGYDAYDSGTSGYLHSGSITTIQAGTPQIDQLASTVITLDTTKVKDGTAIRLGDQTYTFSIGEDSKYKDVENVVRVDDLVKGTDYTETDGKVTLTTTGLEKMLDKFAEVASNNKTFSVGHRKTDGQISLKQLEAVKNSTDMSDAKKLGSYIGIMSVDETKTQEKIDAAKGEAQAKADALQKTADELKAKAESKTVGNPLTLQIGDTSDSFNQMEVKVGDMHVNAMGSGKLNEGTDDEKEVTDTIEDIDISSQDGAHSAIDVIKNAINYVSGIRGDLGAVQNRLEHTANNLSVMAENIQDAESTIRDTDIAEEMMSYTKNNILIQSAQAMLAQANAVPQGVLQLLG